MTSRRLWTLWSIALTATIAILLARLAPLEAVLAARGHGIVDLELAWTAQQFTEITTAWGAEGVTAARTQTLWDFAWIPSYALTLWASLKLSLRSATGTLARRGAQVAALIPVAAGCDVVENIALLLGLGDGPRAILAPLASAMATVKFAILLAAIVVLLACLVARLHRRPTLTP